MAEQTKPKFEWRVLAEANMVGADWKTDWEPWDGPEADPEAVERAICGAGGGSIALNAACECSGFGYGVQVREITTEGSADHGV